MKFRKKPVVIEAAKFLGYNGCGEAVFDYLAHLAAGVKAGHGKEWSSIYSWLHNEYNRHMQAEEERTGQCTTNTQTRN